jgi:hypothetical protein
VSAETWLAVFAGVTLLAAAIGWRRPAGSTGRRVAVSPLALAIGALAAALAAGAVGMAVVGAVNGPATAFTQVWILPGAKPDEVRVGVGNREGAPVEYHVQLVVDGQPVQDWPATRLEANRDWQTSVTLDPGWESAELRVAPQPFPSQPPQSAILWNRRR